MAKDSCASQIDHVIMLPEQVEELAQILKAQRGTITSC